MPLSSKPINCPKSGSGERDDQHLAELIINLVCHATGVELNALKSPTRNNARAARARQIAMYLANVCYQWSLARVGKAFGRDRTTVGYACRLIEDLRDEPFFDSEMNKIEASLEFLPKARTMKLLAPNLTHMGL